MSQDVEIKRRGMIKDFVGELKRDGAVITHALTPGFEKPYKIGPYTPALIGTMRGSGVVGILKMGGTDLEGGPARQEIKYFSTRISHKTKREVPVYIAVPREHHNSLVRVLKELGLAGKGHINTRGY